MKTCRLVRLRILCVDFRVGLEIVKCAHHFKTTVNMVIRGSCRRVNRAFVFQCTFVLICISPSYRKMVEEECETSSIDRRTKERSLHTKYIYRRLHTEYINQGSKNFRYIPVLMSGADEVSFDLCLRRQIVCAVCLRKLFLNFIPVLHVDWPTSICRVELVSLPS